MTEITTSLKGMALTEELLDQIGYEAEERDSIYNNGDIREELMKGVIRSLRAYFLALGVEDPEDEDLRCAVISLMKFEAGDLR
ncbi:hypothetical protein [Bacillus sp. AG4(2022)]|uniref:hypothetical protein n=1 Tax=Bacillus sp. AG4(2022) TaxID=2962594 RepID=UPI002881E73F|nr:hypothetical protein [Bacillus sp. AG4(2022)]MDT0161862.1 hypothetical protein [Bacillus sp. AG4(2022)]